MDWLQFWTVYYFLISQVKFEDGSYLIFFHRLISISGISLIMVRVEFHIQIPKNLVVDYKKILKNWTYQNFYAILFIPQFGQIKQRNLDKKFNGTKAWWTDIYVSVNSTEFLHHITFIVVSLYEKNQIVLIVATRRKNQETKFVQKLGCNYNKWN